MAVQGNARPATVLTNAAQHFLKDISRDQHLRGPEASVHFQSELQIVDHFLFVLPSNLDSLARFAQYGSNAYASRMPVNPK